jgi:hypothetical protein
MRALSAIAAAPSNRHTDSLLQRMTSMLWGQARELLGQEAVLQALSRAPALAWALGAFAAALVVAATASALETDARRDLAPKLFAMGTLLGVAGIAEFFLASVSRSEGTELALVNNLRLTSAVGAALATIALLVFAGVCGLKSRSRPSR